MATMRRTAANERVPERKAPAGPEVVVHDPEPPKAHPDQRWTVTSYPFYEPFKTVEGAEE